MSDFIITQTPEQMAEVTQALLKKERYWNPETKAYEDGNGDPVKGL